MEELKLPPMEPDEAERLQEQVDQVREAANAELTGKLKEIPKEDRNDQWRRGGICAMCRRQSYCKTRCTANRRYASLRIREYVRQRIHADLIRAQMKEGLE